MLTGPVQAFDRDQFVDDCLQAVRLGGDAPTAAREFLQRAISDPRSIERAVEQPTISPMMRTWHCTDELTVLHIVWPPHVKLAPHDHDMFAAIGIYGGREDNSFFRRRVSGEIEPAGGRSLVTGDTAVLGHKAVHAVSNPTQEWTAALHVYGGNFFTAARSTWDEATLERRKLDPAEIADTLEAAAATARRID